MFEHPYLTHQITAFEQEQIERAAERRRFLREHADQIVPRRQGTFRRMLRRVFAGATDAAPRSASGEEPAARGASSRARTARTVDDCVGIGCEPVTANAR